MMNNGLCGCIRRIIIRGRRSELECDLHRLPGCDGDGELLGPREPQAATEIVDLPFRPPADAEVRAGGKVQRARGAEPRLLLLLHRGRRQPQRAATAQLRRAGGGEGGKRQAGRGSVRGRWWGGEAHPRLGRRGMVMDLTASGHLRHRIDLVVGSLLPPPQHPFGGLDGGHVEPGGERRRWRTR